MWRIWLLRGRGLNELEFIGYGSELPSSNHRHVEQSHVRKEVLILGKWDTNVRVSLKVMSQCVSRSPRPETIPLSYNKC
jgi:hypothetical protein